VASTYQGPPERLALYDELLASHPDLERRGATMPYTSLNGHMSSFLDPTGSMALRLPSEAREEFLRVHQARLAVQHGREMKEFVVVPPDLLERPEDLSPWLRRSHDWIGTLKPKPTRRR
jgi:hypothetical protein